MPYQRRAYWSDDKIGGRAFYELKDLDGLIWFGLHFVGIGTIFARRRWREGLAFWSPLLVCVFFNFLGFWPFGAFRTNQFLIAETSVIAALGIDFRVREGSIWARWGMLLPAGVLLVLPLILFERGWSSTKRFAPATHMLDVLKQLSAWQKERPAAAKENLYLDHHSCQPFRFYILYHPRGVRIWNELGRSIDYRCNEDVDVTFSAMRRLPAGSRIWVMAAQRPTRARWPKEFPIERTFSRPPHSLYETHRP
jgi:hypothetical protein